MSERIFVFGSNRQGRHGKGAAATARAKHGAIWGCREGRQGNSYAIITKELNPNEPPVTLDEIRVGVFTFLDYAERNRHLTFNVTPIGCGLAGFDAEQIAPMFMDAPNNVLLPYEFQRVLTRAAMSEVF